MNIFPAIDLFDGKAVRLVKGNYAEMTVYSENPPEIAKDFKRQGAEFIHIVDLEGAKNGDTPNIKTIEKIVDSTKLFSEVGGGIRSGRTSVTSALGVPEILILVALTRVTETPDAALTV